MADIDGLLKIMTDRGSSDLHIKVGSPPAIRLAGRLVVLDQLPTLNADQTRMLAEGMMTEAQREAFDHRHELDFAYSLDGVGRFRVNVFQAAGQRGHHHAAGGHRAHRHRRAGPAAK